MKTISKKRAKTLKEVSEMFKISLYKVNKIRSKINGFYGVPEYMIHGTKGNKWDVSAFLKFISYGNK